jgi:pyruvate dehydrogenase E2 component (dihydrolipoamide acetyltransferase)
MTPDTVQRFLLPDVGEGLTEAEIITWHVAVGDTVTVNQVIVDIETEKSIVELPCPYVGTVLELVAAEGETVAVGSPIIAIAPSVPTAGASETPSAGPASAAAVPPTHEDSSRESQEPRLLVGYGPQSGEPSRARRRRETAAPAPISGTEPARPEPSSHATVRAKPPVRKLAKEMGIDLAAVAPTGPDGTVARDDVLRASRGEASQPSVDARLTGALGATPTTESRIPIRGVRKHTAAAVVASAFTAPHVTEFVTVDVTKTLELRQAVQGRSEFREIKLTPLTFVARAYLLALARTPMATARWDEANQEIVLPGAVNLGIAAATPRGLVVPNIKDAHTMGLLELASAINDLAVTARAGKSAPESLTGGTTTITNIGVFGVDTGTPILNPGETAILAVGAIRRQPWVVDDAAGERIEPRSILQLALSFDHRVLDGIDGSRVLADTAAVLAEPGLALL